MSKTTVITAIYQPFWGTDEFHKSCKRVGFEVYNAHPPGKPWSGYGSVLSHVYKGLLELKKQGYTHVVYADGADSLFLKNFKVPDYVLYSTEKVIWEPLPELTQRWNEYYKYVADNKPMFKVTQWLYLNGGGYCGPVDLLIEFMERYGLSELKGDIPVQSKQAFAILNAITEDFPARLDTNCEIFQTTGFEHPGDFSYDETGFKNLHTGTEPSILHGNGRTNMDHLYKLFNK